MARLVFVIFFSFCFPLILATRSRACNGTATYNVSFLNLLTPERFGSLIPSSGLVYSPVSAISHSNRLSFLTVRGFASPEIEEIAETGDNGALLELANSLREEGRGVASIAAADGPTMPGNMTTLTVEVSCEMPFITVVSMIAPSPDWLVQVSNYNTVGKSGKFIKKAFGNLIAYDAGTDDGREFTPPSDLSLDLPTEPRLNIAPLVEDETDRFEGMVVGKYVFKRIA